MKLHDSQLSSSALMQLRGRDTCTSTKKQSRISMVQSGSDAHQVDVNGAWKATFQIVMNLLMILIMREVSVLWPRVGSPIKKYQPWVAIPLQEVKRRRTVTQINI